MTTVYVGMGSNIDPEKNLKTAAEKLRAQFPVIKFSSVYSSSPQNETNQPDFLNAVAEIETDESLQQLAEKLQSIERELKKATPYRFGPRTIDLDILLYGELISEDSELTIPHPRMHERRFVLEPLVELAEKNLMHPVLKKTIGELLEAVDDQECKQSIIQL